MKTSQMNHGCYIWERKEGGTGDTQRIFRAVKIVNEITNVVTDHASKPIDRAISVANPDVDYTL